MAYFKFVSVGIEKVVCAGAGAGFPGPHWEEECLQAAQHTLHSSGTNSGGNIFPGAVLLIVFFSLHCLHPAYHVKIFAFISHENVQYIFMSGAIKCNEKGALHSA